MITELSTAHKAALVKFTAEERFYLDPRGLRYPPLAGHNLQYRHVTGGDNQPGSHVAQLFAAGTNLVADPEDLTTAGWADANTTRALSSYYYRGKRFSKITATAANGYTYQTVTFTGDGIKAAQMILRKGDDTTNRLLVYDHTALATRLGLTVTWATQAVVATTGTLWFSEWLDSETVWIAGVTTAVTAVNTNRLWILCPTNGNFVYATAAQAENSAYSTPYVNGSRSAATPQYAIAMASTFSLRLKMRPWFAYDMTTNHRLIEWYINATHRLILYYVASADNFQVAWIDGGTSRALISAQFDDGTSYTDVNQWLLFDFAFNPADGQTGSALYVNRSLVDANWGAAPDSKTSHFSLFCIGHEAGSIQANSEIAYIWYAPNKVITQADVDNDWRDVREEIIVWDFNGHGTGKTRCNITELVQDINDFDRAAENPQNGQPIANTLALTLRNKDNDGEGYFSDDQYATFDAASYQYNGSSAEAFLQRQIRVEAETWYGHDFEWMFVGRTDFGAFHRRSGAGLHPYVWITAHDDVALMAAKKQPKAVSYDSYELSAENEASSLVHSVTRLALRPSIKNYLANASFEISTLSASWTVETTGATFTQTTTGAAIGTYAGRFISLSGGACEIAQIVTFTGSKKLNVGQNWTFQLHALDNVALADVGVYLEERDASGVNAVTTGSAASFTGAGGHVRHYVTHQITDSDSDRLRVRFRDASGSSGATFYVDAAGLYEQDRPIDWFAPNDNEGSSGIESADDADESTYDEVGFDVDSVAITHPWAVVDHEKIIWEEMKEIGIASIARYLGMDECGTFRFRSNLATGWEEATELETLTNPVVIDTQISPFRANRLIGHGVKVVEYDYERVVWSLEDAQFVARDEQGFANEAIANGGTYPDEATMGELWAPYGEVRKEPWRAGGDGA